MAYWLRSRFCFCSEVHWVFHFVPPSTDEELTVAAVACARPMVSFAESSFVDTFLRFASFLLLAIIHMTPTVLTTVMTMLNSAASGQLRTFCTLSTMMLPGIALGLLPII